uniref:MATH domain-containing protein n=1 Tax=Panagrolaimus sp. ES5 TaxID=591445 RepID=A0AC34FGU8_9BILA
MMECPFSLEYTISEDRLKALKNAPEYTRLKSDTFGAFVISPVLYSLHVFPNGCNDISRGKTLIYFCVYENEKKIDLKFTITIKSANWSYKKEIVSIDPTNPLHNSDAFWPCICTTEDLFNPEKKFIADGKFVVKVEGVFKTEKLKSEWIAEDSFKCLWNQGFEDFKIIIKEKEIQVSLFLILWFI